MIEALASPWIGHLFLDFGKDARAAADPEAVYDSGGVRLDLSTHQEHWKSWAQMGGYLALQAIAPLAPLPVAVRSNLRFLVSGPGANLCTLAGQAIGCQSVVALDQVESGQTFHRVFLGCDRGIPEHKQIKPLLDHLRQEGQLVLFGIPADRASAIHQSLSSQGFSLRAAGHEGDLAFLSGSIEDPHTYQMRPGTLA
jgi:hypothetical protein